MDLHVYLIQDGIGMMNRDWLPVTEVLATSNSELSDRLLGLINPAPEAADAFVEVLLEATDIEVILSVCVEAYAVKTKEVVDKAAALDNVIAAELDSIKVASG